MTAIACTTASTIFSSGRTAVWTFVEEEYGRAGDYPRQLIIRPERPVPLLLQPAGGRHRRLPSRSCDRCPSHSPGTTPRSANPSMIGLSLGTSHRSPSFSGARPHMMGCPGEDHHDFNRQNDSSPAGSFAATTTLGALVCRESSHQPRAGGRRAPSKTLKTSAGNRASAEWGPPNLKACAGCRREHRRVVRCANRRLRPQRTIALYPGARVYTDYREMPREGRRASTPW